MSLAALVLIVACITNITLGLFVLLRNPKSGLSRTFALITLTIVAWTLTNYFTDHASSLSLNSLFNRLAFLFGFQTIFYVAWFSLYFPRKRELSSRGKLLFGSLFIFGSIFSITDSVAGTVTKGDKGLVFTVGTLSPLYSLMLLGLIILIVRNLSISFRRLTGQEKNQAKLMIFGITTTSVLAIATNVVIPTLVSNWQSAKFGPLLTVIFVASTTYAIVKHKLFDIRLIIARSITYLLSLGTISLIFGTLVIGIGINLLGATHLTKIQQIFFIASALFLGLIFPPLKRFFDRKTNQFFYRDAYDTQAFLNNLNGVLASTIELGVLLRQSSEIVQDNLKPEFCEFSINRTDVNQLAIGSGEKLLTNNELEHIKEEIKLVHQRLIVTDELETSHRNIRKLLSGKNIAVIAKLTSRAHTTPEIGYMLLGYKKSGNPYNSQDLRNIEIIADELVIAVQNALRFEEIQAFNATLQAKINEATHRLRNVNEKLQALDETKDEFISMASHQLRTPLTSVKGYLSMVLEGDAGKITGDQRKLLDQAFISSQRMVYLIADLLNVSRLRTGKFVIESKPSNLAELVEGEINQLQETAKGRKLQLTYEKPANFPDLMLDETKIRQVIMNFVDNAIYYTPAGGHIKVKVSQTPESVEFTVTDDGIGVPKTEQHHLFSKFYRAGNARKARPDGTGLGLFMAKKVIVAQGGSIIFKSKEGQGSSFGFSFAKTKLKVPVRKTPEPEKALAPTSK